MASRTRWRFTGNRLEINFATSAAGSLRVEVQDAGGKPADGFSIDDCDEIIGDRIERIVSWKRGINPRTKRFHWRCVSGLVLIGRHTVYEWS